MNDCSQLTDYVGASEIIAEFNFQTPPQVSPLVSRISETVEVIVDLSIDAGPNSPTPAETKTPVIMSPPKSHIYLPPEPGGDCDAKLVQKIEDFHRLKTAGKSINENLRKSKPFRNPDILEKLVVYCKINEIGSNYPTHLFDPSNFQKEDFYDAIGIYFCCMSSK